MVPAGLPNTWREIMRPTTSGRLCCTTCRRGRTMCGCWVMCGRCRYLNCDKRPWTRLVARTCGCFSRGVPVRRDPPLQRAPGRSPVVRELFRHAIRLCHDQRRDVHWDCFVARRVGTPALTPSGSHRGTESRANSERCTANSPSQPGATETPARARLVDNRREG